MKAFLKYLLISIGVILVVAAFLIPDSAVVIDGKKEKDGKKKMKTEGIPDAEVVTDPPGSTEPV